MMQKRNLFSVVVLATLAVAAFGTRGLAGEATTPVHFPAPKGVVAAPLERDHLVDQLLARIRARNAQEAYALLSPAAKGQYRLQAKVFMNTLRLYHNALYSHVRFDVLSRHSTGENDIYRLELRDRQDRPTLAYLRLVRGADGTWLVDKFSVLPTTKGRDA